MFVGTDGMFLPKTEIPNASCPFDLSRFSEYFHIIPGTDTKQAELSCHSWDSLSVLMCPSPSFSSLFLQKSIKIGVFGGLLGFLHTRKRWAPGPRNISSLDPVTVHPGPTRTSLVFEAPAQGQKLTFQSLQQNLITCPHPTLELLTALFVVTKLPARNPSISRVWPLGCNNCS